MTYPKNHDDDDVLDLRPELWMPVLGYENVYQVSNYGRIRTANGMPLTPVDNGHGYLVVSLCTEGSIKNVRLHRIVLMSFCGREPFSGAQAAHNNGVPYDCRLVNLRWASPQDNADDVLRHGTRCQGSDVHGSVLTENQIPEIRALISQGRIAREIAEIYGVSSSTIHLIKHDKIWRHVL